MKTTVSMTLDIEIMNWIKTKDIKVSSYINEILMGAMLKDKQTKLEVDPKELEKELDKIQELYKKRKEEITTEENKQEIKEAQDYVKKCNLILEYQDNILAFFEINNKQKIEKLAEEFYETRGVGDTLYSFMEKKGYSIKDTEEENA